MHKKRQKPKNLKAALSNLFSYCKKEAGIILFALIMAALGAVLTIAGPNQISKITDYIYNGLTGGISTEAVQEDIQKQIQSGQINIMDYLPRRETAAQATPSRMTSRAVRIFSSGAVRAKWVGAMPKASEQP